MSIERLRAVELLSHQSQCLIKRWISAFEPGFRAGLPWLTLPWDKLDGKLQGECNIPCAPRCKQSSDILCGRRISDSSETGDSTGIVDKQISTWHQSQKLVDKSNDTVKYRYHSHQGLYYDSLPNPAIRSVLYVDCRLLGNYGQTSSWETLNDHK